MGDGIKLSLQILIGLCVLFGLFFPGYTGLRLSSDGELLSRRWLVYQFVRSASVVTSLLGFGILISGGIDKSASLLALSLLILSVAFVLTDIILTAHLQKRHRVATIVSGICALILIAFIVAYGVAALVLQGEVADCDREVKVCRVPHTLVAQEIKEAKPPYLAGSHIDCSLGERSGKCVLNLADWSTVIGGERYSLEMIEGDRAIDWYSFCMIAGVVASRELYTTIVRISPDKYRDTRYYAIESSGRKPVLGRYATSRESASAIARSRNAKNRGEVWTVAQSTPIDTRLAVGDRQRFAADMRWAGRLLLRAIRRLTALRS